MTGKDNNDMISNDNNGYDAEKAVSNKTEHSPLLQTSSYQKEKFSFDQLSSSGESTTLSSSSSSTARHTAVYGRFLLIIVALLYGSLNVCLRLIYALPGPPSASALSSGRGWLAAFCFVPLLVNKRSVVDDPHQEHEMTTKQPQQQKSSSMWRVGAELALFNFGAQGLLTLGLLSTESARASFLTQTSVVMTPVLSALAGQRVNWPVWVGCVLALAGLVLISDNKGVLLSFGPGDILVLAGAFCWSCYLFRLSNVGNSLDEVRLQGVKTFILAILYSIWYIGASIQSDVMLWPGWKEPYAWLLLFYSAVGPGAFADIIQQMGQSTVSASEANVILSLEPVFTAILGLLLLNEATTLMEGFGGCLIIIASIISSF